MNLENLDKKLRLMLKRNMETETLPILEGPEYFDFVLALTLQVCDGWEFCFDPEQYTELTSSMFEESGSRYYKAGRSALSQLMFWAEMEVKDEATYEKLSHQVGRGLISVYDAFVRLILEQ